MADKNPPPKPRRSAAWFGRDDRDGFIYRSWVKNRGVPNDQFDGRPVIGICNTYSELTPCNSHFRTLAEQVKIGVWEAGGFPLEFPVMSLGETLMRPTAMLYRNLASMDVEESIRDNPLDGVVLLMGCDKTTPALLMGAASVDLPAATYRVEWGGQFENMQRAQKRLTIVVPLALLLIVALLYVTYRNVADTLLLFVSVPFACVGGIWALAFREMPLSISAAVGFITLSGVSVLNGMVLASALRERLARGTSRDVAIEETASASLRTIIMTALVASLGFIPMAISEGTGAEVQRPLATVVIGGVITSTLFTLFVLPALYRLVLRVSPAVRPGND